MGWIPRPLATRDVILLAVAVALGVATVAQITPPPSQRIANAIEQGIDRGQAPPPEAAEDDALTGDANEAGYRWAERRGLTSASDCMALSGAFRTGCDDYAKEHTP